LPMHTAIRSRSMWWTFLGCARPVRKIRLAI
jgi:hypothetical protein